MSTLGARLARRLVERLMLKDLRATFRRVVWVGEAPTLPDGPLVVYTNHHGFHDGYLLWLLVRHVLHRPMVIWMEQWERAPLFGPIGALPFPVDNPAQRASTVRKTARRLAADPPAVLLLFPEGVLRPPDQGLGPFRADLARLARLLPDGTRWHPLALRVTWWGEDRPTALLQPGVPHAPPDGHEANRLNALLDHLHQVHPPDLEAGRARLLLDGRRSIHERWNLAPLAPLFRRWT